MELFKFGGPSLRITLEFGLAGLIAEIVSASLVLQNMRLDMIALRSAGVQSAMDDVSSATQEARALSRDIANVLDAAKQVR